MRRGKDDPVPTLREQAERFYVDGGRGLLRFEYPEKTQAALQQHAPAVWQAIQNGVDLFELAWDAQARLAEARIREGAKFSESGLEALQALEILALADRRNDKWQREADADAQARWDAKEHGRAKVSGWVDREGRPIEVLDRGEKLARPGDNTSGVTLERFLGAIVTGRGLDKIRGDLGTTPDSAGGYTVPTFLARDFIDRMRAQSVLLQAGAQTVLMEGKTLRIAKITQDPTVTWRASENAAITPSDPTFGAVEFQAKTIAALTKLSLELAQDSPNAEQAVVRALTGAMALAIDKAGLHGATNGPAGLIAVGGRTQVTGVGAPDYDDFLNGLEALAAADVPIEACTNWIMSPRTWGDLVRLKTGLASDLSPRPLPPALQGHKQYVSTSVLNTLGAGAESAIFGGNFRDVLFGVRNNITVRVLSERYMDSLSIGIVAYGRVDWQVAHPASVLTLEGVTNV